MKTSTVKAKVSRSFVRFIRRNHIVIDRGHAWSVYRVGGRKAILAILSGDKVAVINSHEGTGRSLAVNASNSATVVDVPTTLALPASMPKGAAAKIAGWDDSRAGGGMIHIVLKAGFKFDTGLSIASANTVKDAIAIMRTVVAAH